MAVAAVETPKVAIVPPSARGVDVEIRRFELPDMDRHATWFMPRFVKEFPHLNDRQAIGFLRGVLYSNEFCFLYQDHGVALAQTVNAHTLQYEPIIWERFVWVEDSSNQKQLEAASHFYTHFGTWAKRQGIKIVHVDEKTDVPLDLIQARLGKVNVTEQKYARVT